MIRRSRAPALPRHRLSADDIEESAAQRAIAVVERERHDDIRMRRPPEMTRQHADDLEGIAIEGDGAADDRWIRAEAPAPQPVAEQDDAMAADGFLLRAEVTTERRRHANHGEERRRHFERADPLGFAAAGEVVRARGGHERVGRHRGERTVVTPPVEVVCRRHRTEPSALQRTLLGKRHDAIGTRVRQRPPKHRVDHAEYGGIRPDPEREREHRDDSEAGLTPQHSYAEHDVLSNHIPHRPHAPELLRDWRHAAHANETLPPERRRELDRLSPRPHIRAQPSAFTACSLVVLEQIAGNRLEQVAGQERAQHRDDATRQRSAHASTLSNPRHSATSARRLSLSASTARGRKA